MTVDGAVHLIDDDDAVRDALATLIGSAGMAVTAYASATRFLEAVGGIRGGCVVTDVRMPDLSGLELLHHLRSQGRDLPVIVLTGEADVAMAVEALKGGAADFLEKPVDEEAMLAAVRTALAASARQCGQRTERDERARRLAALSPRERDVLDGLVKGESNKAVAQRLGISPRTVEVYRANLMIKLQAGGLSDLVRIALTVGEEN